MTLSKNAQRDRTAVNNAYALRVESTPCRWTSCWRDLLFRAARHDGHVRRQRQQQEALLVPGPVTMFD